MSRHETMLKRKADQPSPRHYGGWSVKGEILSMVSDRLNTKIEGKARAKGLVKKQAIGHIIIHRREGLVQTGHAYYKGQYSHKG